MNLIYALLLSLGLVGIESPKDEYQIVLTKSQYVEVLGLSSSSLKFLSDVQPKWDQIFSLRVDQVGSDKLPAMLGEYSVNSDRIRFEPRFPLRPGLKYLAVFHPALLPKESGKAPTIAIIEVPKARNPHKIEVVSISPSEAVLPENLLKFYIHFSEPMSRGKIYQHVRLLDGEGKPIPNPFLELGEELWDPSGTRVTILFDPGRIKKGLIPREEVGPVLEQGKNYTLVIQKDWPDENGFGLEPTHTFKFKAGPADTISPDPKTWKVSGPKASSRDPLTIRFPEPLDTAILSWAIKVMDSKGLNIKGLISVEPKGRSWELTPEDAWSKGVYRIIIDGDLEDLAGNSVARPFEVDELRPVEQKVSKKTVELEFDVKD